MKKFAVYSKVKLTKKPTWLSRFKKDYLKEDWHITLKQTCWIKDRQVCDIQNKINELHKGFFRLSCGYDDQLAFEW